MRRLQKLAIAMGLSLFLGGCTSEFPDDLTLIALHAQQPAAGEQLRWVNVVLGTKENFQRYVIYMQYSAYPIFYFCGEENKFSFTNLNKIIKEPSGLRLVDWLDYGRVNESIYDGIGENGYYMFSVFFDASEIRRRVAGVDGKANEIDLLNSPRDICIQFGGGGMLSGYRSNVVRIPKERLAEEMAHPTPGGRPSPIKR